MKLTQHFSLAEFTRSATAAQKGIDNMPSATAIGNMRHLCERVLEPLRDHVGHPITITSGYRSQRLNKAVGGVDNSQHMAGEAADLAISSLRQGREWMEWIMDNCEFDQLILEKAGSAIWLHVSCKRNRNEVFSTVK